MQITEEELLKFFTTIIPKSKRNHLNLRRELAADLGFDSIQLVRLTLELEMRFNMDALRVSEQVDFTEIRTVGDVLDVVNAFQKD